MTNEQRRFLANKYPKIAKDWSMHRADGGSISDRYKMVLRKLQDPSISEEERQALHALLLQLQAQGQKSVQVGIDTQASNFADGGQAKGTDTIPAMLSEGEFVIDADSARRFPEEIKKINDWEPNSGFEGVIRDLDELINAQAFGRQPKGV